MINSERDRKIWELRQLGATYDAIAEAAGLTRERIRQICFAQAKKEEQRASHERVVAQVRASMVKGAIASFRVVRASPTGPQVWPEVWTPERQWQEGA